MIIMILINRYQIISLQMFTFIYSTAVLVWLIQILTIDC